MNSPFVTKFISIFIHVITCSIALAFVLYSQNWFGKGDTYSFLYWTVPFTVAISVSGGTIINFYRIPSFLLRLLFIMITAVILSLGWVYCVSLMLGVWIGAFSIPILYLWITGSAFQLLFLDWRLPKKVEKSPVTKIILELLAFPITVIVVILIMYFLSYVS